MAYDLHVRVPNHVVQQAIDAVMGLPIVIGDVVTDYVDEEQEDTATDPDAPCCCYDSYRPDPDCVAHGIRVLPTPLREAV